MTKIFSIRRKLSVKMSSDSFVELRKYHHVPDSTLTASGKYISVLGTRKKTKTKYCVLDEIQNVIF